MEEQIKKKDFGQRLQDFMASYRGKVIMNYAYSWGAAVVIAGTLFKLTHLPGANFMLWLGMGTEVLVFFVSAFDLPAKHSTAAGADVPTSSTGMEPLNGSYATTGGKTTGTPIVPSSQALVANMPPVLTAEMEETTQAYVARLKEMTEALARFTAQAESLAHDGEQMNVLNHNLSGINALYEIQLRSASAQIGTIDQVHEQTRKMAQQIEELNGVYARMLQAVQVKNP